MTAERTKKLITKLEKKYNARDIDIADILIRADDKFEGDTDKIFEMTERYFVQNLYKKAPRHHFIETYEEILNREVDNKFSKKCITDSWKNYKSMLRILRVSDPELYPWITKNYHTNCDKVITYLRGKK